MSYMRVALLAKMRKLVKGLARPEPRWLKAMEAAISFVSCDISVVLLHAVFWFTETSSAFFAWRVLELKEQGVNEDVVMAVADMEYRMQKKAKKKTCKELKEIAYSEGKKPPPNPYPSAIKEIQGEEKKYVMDCLFNLKVIEIANKMKEERRQVD
ncbi:hypothetical protein SORBI_3006G275700 [Sorghum bicolor]|uniref:Uncharacterized protein n=1 Tax=Sorghum bicolor TaxID=4558 RepID=A0A1B6PPA3_SORBI|nr:hypothetical protein SORBI_3006G275700 [Sorghum bicolor]